MKLLFLIVIMLLPYHITAQENNTTNTVDQGWYWDTGFRVAWNFAGVCYRNKLYYRKALSRDRNNILFNNSFIETGVELGLAPFLKTTAFIIWQPILPIKMTLKVSHYKDLIGEVLVNGANGDYNHGYLSFTGLNPGTVKDPLKINANVLEIEFSPTITLGGRVGVGVLVFVYIPYMHYFYSFDNTPTSQYRYNALNSVILQKQDILWKHTFLLGYSLLESGITAGVSTTIQHIQSIKGVFRSGIFGVFTYEKASTTRPHLIPYVRVQVGTWVKDRYLEQLFVIQAEFGLKYKFQ